METYIQPPLGEPDMKLASSTNQFQIMNNDGFHFRPFKLFECPQKMCAYYAIVLLLLLGSSRDGVSIVVFDINKPPKLPLVVFDNLACSSRFVR